MHRMETVTLANRKEKVVKCSVTNLSFLTSSLKHLYFCLLVISPYNIESIYLYRDTQYYLQFFSYSKCLDSLAKIGSQVKRAKDVGIRCILTPCMLAV